MRSVINADGISQSFTDTAGIVLRHLPIPGHKTYIRIRPKRYECPCCAGKPTTTQRVSWYDVGSSHTRASEDHIMPAMVSSTVTDVSMKEDIGYGAVMGMIGILSGSPVLSGLT